MPRVARRASRPRPATATIENARACDSPRCARVNGGSTLEQLLDAIELRRLLYIERIHEAEALEISAGERSLAQHEDRLLALLQLRRAVPRRVVARREIDHDRLPAR